MKVLAYIKLSMLVILLSACGGIEPKAEEKPKIDPSLPKVSEIKHKSDITSIALEWEPITKNDKVVGYYIYKSTKDGSSNKLVRIAKIDDKFSSHYVDKNLQANTNYHYAFSVYTNDGLESEASNIYLASTLNNILPINYFISISNLPKKVKLLWRPHNNPRVAGYIIQRNSVSNYKWKEVGKVEGRLNSEFIDYNLKDNTIYRYRIRAYTYDNILSKFSKFIEVSTKAVPNPIKNISASKNLPRMIELSWDASELKDFKHYIVYRSKSNNGFFTKIKDVKINYYKDMIKEDGAVFFYKVSVLDKDGLESNKDFNVVSGNTLVKPNTPIIKSTKIQADKAIITWSANDKRTVSYKIIKISKKNWLNKTIQTIVDINGNTYEDKLENGIKYYYKIIGIDSYGIQSKPTVEIELFINKKF